MIIFLIHKLLWNTSKFLIVFICVYSDEWHLEFGLLLVTVTELYCRWVLDIYNFLHLGIYSEIFCGQPVFASQFPKDTWKCEM